MLMINGRNHCKAILIIVIIIKETIIDIIFQYYFLQMVKSKIAIK